MIYTCERCNKIEERSIGGWSIDCSCGGKLLSNDNKMTSCEREAILRQARLKCLSNQTELWTHIYQCEDCGKIHIQHDYNDSNPCGCGALMRGCFTYRHISDEPLKPWTEFFFGGSQPAGTGESNNIVDELLDFRLKKKYSQRLIAAELGISQQYYSLIESKQRPVKASMMKKISRLLQG